MINLNCPTEAVKLPVLKFYQFYERVRLVRHTMHDIARQGWDQRQIWVQADLHQIYIIQYQG